MEVQSYKIRALLKSICLKILRCEVRDIRSARNEDFPSNY